jgi:hypothetical protein
MIGSAGVPHLDVLVPSDIAQNPYGDEPVTGDHTGTDSVDTTRRQAEVDVGRR